jgi:hypothetical protein
MDRALLESLSREHLIEIILAQTQVIGQLTQRVEELEARLGGPPKTPGNSSVPPSLGRKPLAHPLHDEFVDRANFFIDLLAGNALGFRRPFCVHSHINHHQDRVDDRIVRQMVRYPMVEKITAALAHFSQKSN